MSSIVYRSVKGSKLTSAEVDGNFQYLENLVGGQGNSIVTENGFTLVDQDLTIAADWVWKILNITYTNTAAVVINIPFASSGNQRIDLIVANQSNTFERIAGVESASNPSAPAVPLNKIFVTFITVTDGVIDEPETPIVGTQFKQKNESQKITQVLGGTDAVIELRTFGQQYYSVLGPVTSVAGFSMDLITASPTSEAPYSGKDFFFENNTDHNVTLKNEFSPVDIPFNFGADLVVPVGGKVWMKYYTTGLELVMKSWSDVVSEKISITHSPNTLISMTTLGTWAFFDYRGFAGATLSYTLGTGANPSITADLSTAMSIIPPIGKKLKGFYIWTNSGVGFEIGILKSDVLTPSTLTTNDTNTNRRFIQKFALGNNQRQPEYHEITSDDADASAGSQYFPCVINTSGSTQSLRFCAIYIIE